MTKKKKPVTTKPVPKADFVQKAKPTVEKVVEKIPEQATKTITLIERFRQVHPVLSFLFGLVIGTVFKHLF